MGILLNCRCATCGYFKRIPIGSTMFKVDRFLIPALDKAKKEVVSVDLSVAEKKPGLVPYGTGASDKSRSSKNLISVQSSYVIPRKHNFCPGCGKNTLGFEEAGLID